MNRAYAAVASMGLFITAIATAQMTIYVNGTCGDDGWTGSSPVCQAPDGPKRRKAPKHHPGLCSGYRIGLTVQPETQDPAAVGFKESQLIV